MTEHFNLCKSSEKTRESKEENVPDEAERRYKGRATGPDSNGKP